MTRNFLAFDLGAESGRAMLAQLHSGVLELAELHRFPNDPIRGADSLRWNVDQLWREIRRGLEQTSGRRLESVGIDTWGVDYVLLDDRGALLHNPFHYRDARTTNAMAEFFTRVARERIYEITGIQFLPFNTLYQLFVERRGDPGLARTASAMLTMPDYFNYRLTGRMTAEYTIATTTQCVDVRGRCWSDVLIAAAEIPRGWFAPIIDPGTIVGPIAGDDVADVRGVPLVATACHDTASAVAAIPSGPETAFLSSGTWSLFGVELDSPVLTPAARDANFTNEGGAGRTIRFLKNIGGLWLLQACRRSWEAAGTSLPYDRLLDAARDEGLSFQSLVDPDDPGFLNPEDMPSSIDAYCARTGQPPPRHPGAYARAILESLACAYRVVLESIERLSGRHIAEIRIMGGGSRNRLLNQLTADATGRTVVAGPVEATALGNIALQMVATGAVGSLAEARAVIDRSFPVERFTPIDHEQWDAPLRRFRAYVEGPR